MSSNEKTYDKTKKYWQIYYAKNKEKIKARIKKNRDCKRQMTNHKIRYHTDKQYRMRSLVYCRQYKQKLLNLPVVPLPNGNDKSLFVLDLY
jgi:hypothetical protein